MIDSHQHSSEVAQVADFTRIRYAQGWEDPRCLERALNITSESTVLSIAAAGDNSLALLLMGDAGPRQVVSIDMNPAQCALVELKRAAIRTLNYEDLLRFLGVTVAHGTRMTLYSRVRTELPSSARTYWDTQRAAITTGIIHAGKLESYFRLFRTRILPMLHRSSTIRSLLTEHREPAERAIFWDEHIAHRRWHTVLRTFCSPRVVGRLGRDPSFFAHVDMPDVGRYYLERVRHAGAVLDPVNNPYLHYIFLGNYTPSMAMPDYLNPATIDTLRNRLDRLVIVCDELESYLAQAPQEHFSAANLSDVFEWMSQSHFERLLRSIVDSCTPGARIAYWNNLVLRSRPLSLANVLASLDDLACEIHHDDRSFFYRAFRVEEVLAA